MLPPVHEFTALESLSLTGRIDGLGSLLNRCRHLHVLSVTYTDSRQLTLPLDGEFPVLEKLSLSGNIVDLTSSLNRCPRLRVLRVTFCGVTLLPLKAALTSLEVAGPFDFQLSLLGFKSISQEHNNNTPCLASLLRIAARLSPQEFLFEGCSSQWTTEPFPSFHHTTSIQMNLGPWISFKPLPGSDFSDLEMLSLSACNIINLDTMVTLCPRLRELRVTEATGNIKFHSRSLQKLYVSTDRYTHRHSIDILTPVLKQLELVVQDNGDISVSILAPTVEKVWWEPFSLGSALVFDFWSLGSLRLETAEDTCSPGVLGLYMSTSRYAGAKTVFSEQMEKFLVVDFSVLELHLEEKFEHHFGALIRDRIGDSVMVFKINRQRVTLACKV
ncbi:hypothetical protein ACQ4PT_027816 [Festuca glaucescens]